MSDIERWWIWHRSGRKLPLVTQDAAVADSLDRKGELVTGPLITELAHTEAMQGAVATLEQARDEFRAALAADESAEYLRDLVRDFIAATDTIGGQSAPSPRTDQTNGETNAR